MEGVGWSHHYLIQKMAHDQKHTSSVLSCIVSQGLVCKDADSFSQPHSTQCLHERYIMYSQPEIDPLSCERD